VDVRLPDEQLRSGGGRPAHDRARALTHHPLTASAGHAALMALSANSGSSSKAWPIPRAGGAIGKGRLTPSIVAETKRSLEAHELIKCASESDDAAERREIAEQLAAETDCGAGGDDRRRRSCIGRGERSRRSIAVMWDGFSKPVRGRERPPSGGGRLRTRPT